jgi:hypothetical protein
LREVSTGGKIEGYLTEEPPTEKFPHEEIEGY